MGDHSRFVTATLKEVVFDRRERRPALTIIAEQALEMRAKATRLRAARLERDAMERSVIVTATPVAKPTRAKRKPKITP